MKKNAVSKFADQVSNQMLFLGIGFILWAILFVVWPASFVYLISAFFVLFGGESILYAVRIRRMKNGMESWFTRVMKKIGV
jgi:hypothetical protein